MDVGTKNYPGWSHEKAFVPCVLVKGFGDVIWCHRLNFQGVKERFVKERFVMPSELSFFQHQLLLEMHP